LDQTPESTSPRTCPSCGRQAAGRYCSACGEKFLSEADFNFKHFLFHHIPHEVMHWDGKLGHTLRKLVFAPGAMAAEYVRGRRQPYLNPLRLYLVMFVTHVFLSGFGTTPLTLAERVQRFDSFGVVTWVAGNHLPSELDDPIHGAHDATLSHWLSEGATLMIVFFVALALLGIMRKYRRRYLEHLTLALNVITFTLLVMVVGDVVTLLLGRGSVSELAEAYRTNAAAVVLPFYWVFAIRRFYGTSWGGAIAYTLAITAAALLIAQVLDDLMLLLLIAAAANAR
jgi:Protein of unknown function (DUF3667)